MSILSQIFAHKREETALRRREVPLTEMRRAAEAAPRPLDFAAALRQQRGKPALIAEVKRASPSRGTLAPHFDPIGLARIYQAHGASAISVLTDETYFQGRLSHLRAISQLRPRLPLLRKDFLFDPYQLYEARAAGADAVLLIASHLEPRQLQELHALALVLGMTPLVEVHDAGELDAALACEPRLVGINNRNLHNFTVDLAVTLTLRPQLPPAVCVVSESGIHSHRDVQQLARVGVDAVLVGEALVTAANTAAKVRELSARAGPLSSSDRLCTE